MKIAIALDNSNGMDSRVGYSFGRAPFFGFIDEGDATGGTLEIVPNPYSNAASGAGIQAAQFVVDRGANTVIAGSVGPNSYNVLSSAGARILSAPQVSLREVLAMYGRGELTPISTPGATGGGMGRGGGIGRGMGGRRGMGGGRGMGRGRGGW